MCLKSGGRSELEKLLGGCPSVGGTGGWGVRATRQRLCGRAQESRAASGPRDARSWAQRRLRRDGGLNGVEKKTKQIKRHESQEN